MLDALFAVVHDGGEDDDGHGQREDQEAQLGGARLQRVAEDPETLRVARKFENRFFKQVSISFNNRFHQNLIRNSKQA